MKTINRRQFNTSCKFPTLNWPSKLLPESRIFRLLFTVKGKGRWMFTSAYVAGFLPPDCINLHKCLNLPPPPNLSFFNYKWGYEHLSHRLEDLTPDVPSTEDAFSVDTRALLFPKWAFFHAPVVNEDNSTGENVSFCPRTETQPGPSGEHTLFIYI